MNTEQFKILIKKLPIVDDLHKMIGECIFEKCLECNKILNENQIMDYYTNDKICVKCFLFIYNYKSCFRCGKVFDITKNEMCSMCNQQCMINCNKCIIFNRLR